MTNLLNLIRFRYNTFSDTQKVIADYILKNPERAVHSSISKLAESCNTSETTIMRFLKKLDIDSYQVFRITIAQELSNEKVSKQNKKSTNSSTSIANEIVDNLSQSLEDMVKVLNMKEVEKCVDAIINKKRITFYGAGSSAYIASDFCHKAIRLGINAQKESDPHIMNILSTFLTKDDLVVAVSHSGESKEVLEAVEIAKKNKATICAITSYSNSSLSSLADIKIISSTKAESVDFDARLNRILQLALIDIIMACYLNKIGKKAKDALNESILAVAYKKK